ncbi:MAG: endonuclease/exonuclease/phosphatase family protein [Patescibacteria group bacterium]
MKLVQLNTWSCKLPTEIIRLFETERPDFTCLQEVVSAEFDGKILDTIDQITDEYPFLDYYYTPLVEFNFMHHSAKRGNMITSQFPIKNSSELWTHGGYIEDFDYSDSGGYNAARNIAHAKIETPQGFLNILTLHGYHIKEHKNGNEETLRACRELIELAASIDGPLIITGDFNLAPESESIKLVSRYFRNLSTEYKLSTTRNHLTSKTDVCDYIFTNDKIKVNNFYMSDIVASDHNALVLDFDVITA